ALEDPLVRTQRACILCNIGNFHTLAFHMLDGQIIGTFEHHTGEISRSHLEEMLTRLARGTLMNDEVFSTSGHGALLLRPDLVRSETFPFLAVTGPRRELLRGSGLKHYESVPHGDMMIAGCYGLLRALADQHSDLAPPIEAALL